MIMEQPIQGAGKATVQPTHAGPSEEDTTSSSTYVTSLTFASTITTNVSINQPTREQNQQKQEEKEDNQQTQQLQGRGGDKADKDKSTQTRQRTSSALEMVQLVPFIHQVGGHHSMLRFDDRTLCKPLIKREQKIYEALPDAVKEFTPEYRGIIEVKYREDSDGYITLMAMSPRHQKKGGGAKSSSPSNAVGVDKQVNGDVLIANKPPSAAPPVTDEVEVRSVSNPSTSTQPMPPTPVSSTDEVNMIFEEVWNRADVVDDVMSEEHPSSSAAAPLTPPTGVQNPWSLRCHKEQLRRMRKWDSHKFILLENLAYRFQNPCILDLKMGTRQHGDDASEHKVRRHTEKCEKSTSSKLGVRLCGMQVYQCTTEKYVCFNKYYGRNLDTTGFRSALSQFLHNGERIRAEFIPVICRRLRNLRSTLSTLDTFRFYSSSLLVMYEGAAGIPVSPASSPSKQQRGRKRRSNRDHMNDNNNNNGVSQEGADLTADAVSGDGDDDNDNNPDGPERGIVDVRMIDFAHTTHADYPSGGGVDSVAASHQGPDKGYLLGLDNLVQILEEIQQEEDTET